jgi:hypothetical protein
VEYLYNLDSNSKDNSILRLVGITRDLIVDIVVVEEEVIEDLIEDIVDIDKVWD